MCTNCDDSSDFSKYFPREDKPSLYDYSVSCNNETLLLETTDIHRVPTPDCSLLQGLCEQLEVTLESRLRGQSGGEVKETCRQLMGSLRKLEEKVARMEAQEKGRAEKNIKGQPTFASIRGCRCEEDSDPLARLLDLMDTRSRMEMLRRQKEELQRQVLRLQVANEDLRRQLRKMQGENLEAKELLRQCQQITRKHPNREDYFEPQQSFRTTHGHCSPLLHELSREKQNFQVMFDRKVREEELRGHCKTPPMTPNPLIRTAKYIHQQGTTHTKAPPSRFTQLNQRVEHLLDVDNQKTQSKERGHFSRSPKNHLHRVLKQTDYQIEEKALEHFDTMTTLPDSVCPSFPELKRVQSGRTLTGCLQDHLSLMRSLPKSHRR